MPRRSPSRSLSLVWLVVLAIAITIAAIAGCEKSPDTMHLDNPFDPGSTAGGDGLHIRALSSPNQILLTWSQPQET